MEPVVLKKKILSTVAYYDGLNYPLTVFEVWKYLISLSSQEKGSAGEGDGTEQCTLHEVWQLLEERELRRWIESERGFYFLKGRQKLVRMRIRRNKIAGEKLKRLQRVVFWMRLIPFFRMIAVTGRLSMKSTEPKSDWDVLVVLKSGRIWIGRTLVTLFAELIGKRRKPGKVRDRICLNYFVTESSLEITNKDLFSSNEYSFILPLWGRDTFRKFQEENDWLKKYRTNFLFSEIPNRRLLSENHFFGMIQRAGEALLDWDWLEEKLRQIEKEKIEANPLTHVRGSLVSANDEALIFLPHPQGPEIFDKFKNKIERLLIGNRAA